MSCFKAVAYQLYSMVAETVMSMEAIAGKIVERTKERKPHRQGRGDKPILRAAAVVPMNAIMRMYSPAGKRSNMTPADIMEPGVKASSVAVVNVTRAGTCVQGS